MPPRRQRWKLRNSRRGSSAQRGPREQAVVAEKDVFITELKALIAKLEGQVRDYRHTKFGPKSEKLDPAQLELALEDLETAIVETQAQIAAVEDRIVAGEADPEKRKPRAPRKARALPDSLPRVERVGRARQHHLSLWLWRHGPDRRGGGGSGNGPGDRFPDDRPNGWITSRRVIR